MALCVSVQRKKALNKKTFCRRIETTTKGFLYIRNRTLIQKGGKNKSGKSIGKKPANIDCNRNINWPMSIHCWCGLSKKVNMRQSSPLPKERPRKAGQAQGWLIERLKMENGLLWNFLSAVGRKWSQFWNTDCLNNAPTDIRFEKCAYSLACLPIPKT